MAFDSVELIIELLHKHGYAKTQDFVLNTIGCGEYSLNYSGSSPNSIWVKPLKTNDPAYCIRFKKQRLHFHGSKIGCHRINLSSPWSISNIDAIISGEEVFDVNSWKACKGYTDTVD